MQSPRCDPDDLERVVIGGLNIPIDVALDGDGAVGVLERLPHACVPVSDIAEIQRITLPVSLPDDLGIGW